MSRQGDNVIAVADLIEIDKFVTFSVSLVDKNTEDSGDGTVVTGGTLSSTKAGRIIKSYSGLKEMVRYKITALQDSPGDGLLFRMLEPVWYDTVNADTEA